MTSSASLSSSTAVDWYDEYSFRGQPYRYLHHQRGLVGTFTVRLLEGRNLKRSYWSALAIGPVKHLGFSKAHGEVSSYCTIHLEFVEPNCDDDDDDDDDANNPSTSRSNSGSKNHPPNSLLLPGPEDDRKQPAAAAQQQQRRRTSSLSSSSSSVSIGGDAQKSPVISQNNNPVWDSNVIMKFPFRKPQPHQPSNGMRIHVQLRVEEDATPLEQFLPGGGFLGGPRHNNNNKSTNKKTNNNNNNDGGGGSSEHWGRLLGVGELDVTHLCLGQGPQGQPIPSVQDAWIPIALPHHTSDETNKKKKPPPPSAAAASAHDGDQKPSPPSSSKQESNKKMSNLADNDDDDADDSCTGYIRIMVWYETHGMEPQRNDIVALECFARSRPWNATSCRPILAPPSQPWRVVDIRSPYLLLETMTVVTTTANQRDRDNHTPPRGLPSPRPNRIKLHRHAVFVVERQNWIDTAHKVAWLPADVVRSTPWGRAAGQWAGPVVAAGQEVCMPAFLSFKLLWMAVRTTAIAGLQSLQVLGSTLVQEGTQSLLDQPRNNNNNHHQNNPNNGNDDGRRRGNGGIKLVQL